jgi:alkylation response protein AidB-like acyl-CoA dehydrogenase
MDFALTEDQLAITTLARQIVGDLAENPDKLAIALDDAGLLSLTASEEAGGSGLGAIEMCLVLIEVGRSAVDTPAARVLVRNLAERTGGDNDQLLALARCAEAQGVSEGALALTAAYAKEREQFERPIGSFQAVAHRLADGYIAHKLAALTLWQAAWRYDEGLPLDVELATARLWATDTLHAVGHTCVHVHGGVGIDLDGVAHRYYSASQRLIRALGSATVAARDIGRSLAS